MRKNIKPAFLEAGIIQIKNIEYGDIGIKCQNIEEDKKNHD